MNNPTEPQSEKRAPVQGYAAGIPWSMHLKAYVAYCQRYSAQPALITGNCRGGFGVEELDMFIPGWREELSEITALRAQVAELTRERNTAFGNGITAGKKEALNYSEDERKAYGMHVEFATLTREVEQLREDKERLDWKPDGFMFIKYDPLRSVNNWTLLKGSGRVGDYSSFRTAIDAAMSARNEKETE